jgi:hypothetical protein
MESSSRQGSGGSVAAPGRAGTYYRVVPLDPAELAARLGAATVSAPALIGEPGTVLFHHTTRATALEHVLRGMSLRMGPFANVNDPREAKDWQITPFSAIGTAVAAGLSETLTIGLQRHTKILCMSCDEDPIASSVPLCRGWAHPRMWAQYAGNHEGVCLVIDRQAFADRMQAYSHLGQPLDGAVTYTNDQPAPADSPFVLDIDAAPSTAPPVLLTHHVGVHGRGLFFTKLKDWADEHEYRWIIRGNDEVPIFVDMTGCLLGVILGWRCPDPYLPSFQALCGPAGVALLRIDWEEGHPVLDYVP